MRIIHLTESIDPSAGGPIEYARVMADAHATAGHESVFITLDPPDLPYRDKFPHEAHLAGPRGPGGIAKAFAPALEAVASKAPSVAVIHGLWNWSTMGGVRTLKRTGTPWVTFTHGMLDPYFRVGNTKKNIAKQISWTLLQGRAMSQADWVLFTCEEEQRLAKDQFIGHNGYRGRTVAFCASDMEDIGGSGSLGDHLPKLAGRDYLLFLSRIHSKKGCDILVEAFARIAAEAPSLNLVIAGPDRDGLMPGLKAQATSLGVTDRIHWPGMLMGEIKAAAYRSARAFVLPSHQENFGMVVAEALSASTPVLISDKVNIWREVEASGAGLVGPDTLEGTTQILKRFVALSGEELATLRGKARTAYEANFSVAKAASDLEEVLAGLKQLK